MVFCEISKFAVETILISAFLWKDQKVKKLKIVSDAHTPIEFE